MDSLLPTGWSVGRTYFDHPCHQQAVAYLQCLDLSIIARSRSEYGTEMRIVALYLSLKNKATLAYKRIAVMQMLERFRGFLGHELVDNPVSIGLNNVRTQIVRIVFDEGEGEHIGNPYYLSLLWRAIVYRYRLC